MSNLITKGKGVFGTVAAKSVILNGVVMTTANAAVALLSGVTAGTVAASKGVVVDANKALTGLVFKIGSAATTTAAAPVSHVGDSTSTGSGTTQNTEYVLNTYTLPANAFNAAGMVLMIRAFGVTTANANAKTLKLYFGSTVVATLAGSTASGKVWCFEAMIVRTGTSTQTCYGRLSIDGTVSPESVTTAPTEDETSTIVIKQSSINTAAAAASGTGDGLQIQILN